MTTQHPTLYDALLAIEAEAKALRARLTHEQHDWSTGAWEACEVKVSIYDHWAGAGYASEGRVGLRQTRHCTLCGWREKREKLLLNEEPKWVEAP